MSIARPARRPWVQRRLRRSRRPRAVVDMSRSPLLFRAPTGLADGLARKEIALRRTVAAIRPLAGSHPAIGSPDPHGPGRTGRIRRMVMTTRHLIGGRRGIASRPVLSDADRRRYDQATAHLEAPFAVVDLDAFDANARDLLRRAAGTPVRLASKSVRCRNLMERARHAGMQGILAFTLPEAMWLAEHGARTWWSPTPPPTAPRSPRSRAERHASR